MTITLPNSVLNSVSPSTIALSITEGTIDESQNVNAQVLAGISLSGEDPTGYTLTTSDARFAITGKTTLSIVAGADFDFETEQTIEVTVTAKKQGAEDITVIYTLTLDNVDELPVFSSSVTADVLTENVEVSANTPIYTAIASGDAGLPVVYSLADAAHGYLFNIDENTGAVTFKDDTTPDFENISNYIFVVTATSGNVSATQAVIVGVTDVNEAPTITASTARIELIDGESIAANAEVYLVTATSAIEGQDITYTLSGVDADLFNIDNNGVVRFNVETEADFDTNEDGYSFTVVASAGNEATSQNVHLSITPVDEFAPVISGDLAGFSTPYIATHITGQLQLNGDDDSGADHQTHTVTLASSSYGTYGTLTIVDNEWTYVLDTSTFGAVHPLGVGQYEKDIFTIAAGEHARQEIVITVAGENDVPEVFVTHQLGTVTENAEGANIDGIRFHVFDVDAGDQDYKVSGFEVRSEEKQGIFSDAAAQAFFEVYLISGTGSNSVFGVKLKEGVVINELGDRSSYDLSFVYFDGHPGSNGGSWRSNTVTVMVKEFEVTSGTTGLTLVDGDNMLASDALYRATATTLAEGQNIDYTLSGVDADLFNIDGNGVVRFNVETEADYDTNADGYSFTVAVSAGGTTAKQDVTIAITAVDEHTPTIGGDLTGSVVEGASGIAGLSLGHLTLSGDLDSAEHQTTDIDQVFIQGTYGQIAFNSGNGWIYRIDNKLAAVQGLGEGEVATDSFTVTAGDATEVITISITGENDAPRVAVIRNAGSVPESTDSANVDGIVIRAFDFDVSDQNYAASSFTVLSANKRVISDAAVQELFEVYLVSGTGKFSVFGVKLKAGVSLDYESGITNYALAFSYTDDDTTSRISSTANITVTDTDPEITSGATSVVIVENTQIGSNEAIYTATAAASDGAAVTYSIEGADANLFKVNANSGAVTFKVDTTPDYETVASYSFTVVASAGSQQSSQNVTVVVTAVDEHAPQISGSLTGDVTVGSSLIATGTIDVSGDRDKDDGSDHYTTTITPPDNLEGIYGTIAFDGDTWTYTLNVDDFDTKSLDIGEQATEVFTVTAGSASHDITITITGGNDAPDVVVDSQLGSVAENAAGANIASINFRASDLDASDQNYDVSGFTIKSADIGVISDAAVQALFDVYLVEGSGASSVFGIKLKEGVSLDREIQDSYALELTYTDGDAVSTVSSTVTIAVTNVVETNVFASDPTGITLSEETPIAVDDVIYTAVALADGDAVAIYSLEGGDAGLFAIDASTGAVTFKAATTPNFETNQDGYSFTVKAVIGDQELTQDVSITVTDIDETPTFTSPDIAEAIFDQQRLETGHVIYTADATPKFEGQIVTYSMLASKRFDIDPETGVVTTAKSIVSNYENRPQGYSITIMATVDGYVATHELIIPITPVDEFAPVVNGSFAGSITAGSTADAITGRINVYGDRDRDDDVTDHHTAIVTPPDNLDGVYGTISFEGNTWTYTINNDGADTLALNKGDVVTDTFTITAGQHVTKDIVITITGQDDAPIGQDSILTLEGQTNAYTFTSADFLEGFVDPEGDTLTSITITSLPSSGELVLYRVAVSEGQVIAEADIARLKYFDTLVRGNSVELEYSVSDGKASSAIHTLTINQDALSLSLSATRGIARPLTGTDGDDIVVGSEYGDVFVLGLGADTATGGGGTDIFIHQVGLGVNSLTVTDFEFGRDTLTLVDNEPRLLLSPGYAELLSDGDDITGIKLLIGTEDTVTLMFADDSKFAVADIQTTLGLNADVALNNYFADNPSTTEVVEYVFNEAAFTESIFDYLLGVGAFEMLEGATDTPFIV